MDLHPKHLSKSSTDWSIFLYIFRNAKSTQYLKQKGYKIYTIPGTYGYFTSHFNLETKNFPYTRKLRIQKSLR